MDQESRRLLDHARISFERVRQRQLMFFGGVIMAFVYLNWVIALAGLVACFLGDYFDMKASAATLKARDTLSGDRALQAKLKARLHLSGSISTFLVILFIVGCTFASHQSLRLVPMLFLIAAALYWAVFEHKIKSLISSRTIIVGSGALVMLAAPIIAYEPDASSTLYPKAITAGCVFYFIHLCAIGRAERYDQSLNQIMEAERSLREIAEADQHKSDLLRILSHELRTPLNGVLGMTQLMSLGPLNEKQKEQISVIASSGARLDQLLNEVMDSERLSAGRLRIVKEPVAFMEFISPTLDRHRRIAEAKGLSFEVEALTDLPDYIVIDAARVAQCLDHLISNAIKFTNEGGVKVSCAHSASSPPPRLTFTIKDTGVGMSDDAQARLFKRFSQADMSESRGYGGMGLGLWISKILSQLMGGGLTVASQLGVGSTFTLDLIAEAVDAPAVQAGVSAQRGGQTIDLAS